MVITLLLSLILRQVIEGQLFSSFRGGEGGQGA